MLGGMYGGGLGGSLQSHKKKSRLSSLFITLDPLNHTIRNFGKASTILFQDGLPTESSFPFARTSSPKVDSIVCFQPSAFMNIFLSKKSTH